MGFLTPNASGEHAVLRTFALQQLMQMRTTVTGLSTEQVHTAPTASDLTLAALLLHAGQVAVYWSTSAAVAPKSVDAKTDFPADMQEAPSFAALLADDRSMDEVLAFFDRCVRITTDNIDRVTSLDVQVPVPDAPWYPEDLTHWQARWCLLHLSTEVARHVGHADIIRETIDGKNAFELNDEPYSGGSSASARGVRQ